EWSPGTIPYNTQTQLPTSGSPDNTADHQIYLIGEGDSSDPNSEDYNREYANWPSSDGAPAHDGEYFTDLNANSSWDVGEPFDDFDGDSNYDGPDGLLATGEDPPWLVGDTQAWWVMNDLDTSLHDRFWRTDPLGLEAHVLVSTRMDDPIYENVQFRTITLVNKGGHSIDSTYFSVWSDVDLGDATDDAGGCDSSLSLAYIYNGNPSDQSYGLRPPAVGYDLLQGPLIPSLGDTTVYEGSTYADINTLDMTASIMITKDNPFPDPENANEGYNMVQGLFARSGDSIVDPGGNITTFHVAGDPVTGNGWTALNSYWVGDRRILMSSGPFQMEPWDDLNSNGQADFGEPGVQIIHTALIIVDGADHLDAISNLRYVSRYVQDDFDHGFETYAMESPSLLVSAYDQEIILNLDEGAKEYESSSFGSYEFEGYNLYQGASSDGPWTLRSVYDKINGVGVIQDQTFDENGLLQSTAVQFGDDIGLEHIISITTDYLNDDAPLTNNKAYYFAVDAYAYSESALPKVIKSEMQVISVRPHNKFNSANVAEMLEIEHAGIAEVTLSIEVLDPSQLKGLDYELGFEYDSLRSLGQWYLLRDGIVSQDTLHRSAWFEKYTYAETGNIYHDGYELSIGDVSFSPPAYKSDWQQTINIEGTTFETLTLRALSDGGVDSLAYDIMGTQLVHLDTLFGHGYYWDWYEIEERSDGTYFILHHANQNDVLIQGFASAFGGQNGDRLADIPGLGGGSQDIDFLQSDLEIRFTEEGQNASRYSSFNGYAPEMTHVPFEIWDIERNIQLCVGINDYNHSGGIQDTSMENWENTLDHDWVIVFDRDYEIYGSEGDSLLNNPHSGWAWQFNSMSKFSIGDVVTIHFLNPVIAGVDVYSWSTEVAGMAYDEDALDRIQVFPNPYFGYQSEQASFSEPYVTLSNLPEQECTIRIYSLGGTLVRRFDHEIGTYEYWDLLNDHGSPVASGMYIVHIEVSDLGNKILKMAVFQPE
ncbi:MAG: hypothetical protein HOG76_10080, partial [Candidatus Marinimicrobia bacterium]|nr:hypothetical protein [Candidatus Neomarinimicrobiota bacterium]MBT5465864.1 hypothetical protein [Candidatus Neomarinimicrobiota bacterium]MBT6003170.1 hypothetical protein [Candidatus Neomarinimicrobiota bacterium]MBT7686080.1 hypothetical protein [Candidatus Neomarinimicrobiota bacterium]